MTDVTSNFTLETMIEEFQKHFCENLRKNVSENLKRASNHVKDMADIEYRADWDNPHETTDLITSLILENGRREAWHLAKKLLVRVYSSQKQFLDAVETLKMDLEHQRTTVISRWDDTSLHHLVQRGRVEGFLPIIDDLAGFLKYYGRAQV